MHYKCGVPAFCSSDFLQAPRLVYISPPGRCDSEPAAKSQVKEETRHRSVWRVAKVKEGHTHIYTHTLIHTQTHIQTAQPFLDIRWVPEQKPPFRHFKNHDLLGPALIAANGVILFPSLETSSKQPHSKRPPSHGLLSSRVDFPRLFYRMPPFPRGLSIINPEKRICFLEK